MSSTNALPEPLRRLDAPPVFVVGEPRSGTTWVYDLLVFPDEVCGILESWLFTPGLGLGSLFDRAHWDAERVEEVSRLAGRRLGLGQLLTRGELVEQVRTISADWLGRKLEPRHRFLVEKTPLHLHFVETIAEVYPEARFVHVLRDGRDVAVSVDAAARSWNPGWRPLDRRGIYRFAQRWRVAMGHASRLRELLGSRFLEVRYEDLGADPEGAVRRLYAFCGFPEGDLASRAVEATDFRRYEGRGEDRFRRRGVRGEWRERLDRLDALLFQLGARDALVGRDYERSRLWWMGHRRRRS